MNATSMAWAAKAEADLATAEREIVIAERPNLDGVCHHAKECALNLLKARLVKAEIPFPQTSHLVVLLELCLEVEPAWEGHREALRFLTTAAAQSLEAPSNTTLATAEQAVCHARAFWDDGERTLPGKMD